MRVQVKEVFKFGWTWRVVDEHDEVVAELHSANNLPYSRFSAGLRGRWALRKLRDSNPPPRWESEWRDYKVTRTSHPPL